MSDLLRLVSFTRDQLGEVGDFDFGEEPYQKELADWLRQDAILAMERGTKVWLYVNQADEIVGYGSLGVTRWKYPDPAASKTELVVVPAVALRKEFWRRPDGPAEERYSSQMMFHLLDEALSWPGKLPAVGLFVHPDNLAAIKLYQRFGFRRFSHCYTDPSTGVIYSSFIRPLVHP